MPLIAVRQGDKYRLKDIETNSFVSDRLYDETELHEVDLGRTRIYTDPEVFLSEYFCKGNYGLKNKMGQKMTPPIYKSIWIPNGADYAFVQKGRSELKGLWGVADATGREIASCKYTRICPFHEGFALVFNGDFISYDNRTGKIKYKNKRYGFIDKSGEEVIPLQYDEASSFSSGLAAVKLGNLWGYIDKAGCFKVPLSFDKAETFSEDMAAIKVGGKYGFIDKTGMIKILPIYSRVKPFCNGGAIVWKGEKTGVIDKNGVEIVPVIYDLIIRIADENYYLINLDGKSGILDAQYGFLTKVAYDNADLLFDKYPYVTIDGIAYLVSGEGALSELGDISSPDPYINLPF